MLLVYCRTGRRSKEAPQKLAEMGDRIVFEFGGIVDWTGEIAAEEKRRKIKISDGEHTAIYLLNDSPPQKACMPCCQWSWTSRITAAMRKSSISSRKSIRRRESKAEERLTRRHFFSPWGNVVLYYERFDAYPGLYLPGQASEGAEQVSSLSGTIRVEVEQ